MKPTVENAISEAKVRIRRTFGLLGLGLVLGTPGCSYQDLLEPERDETASLQTDALSYTAHVSELGLVEIHVELTYTNRSGETRYLAQCLEGRTARTLEKRTGSGWTYALGQICPGIFTPHVAVAPGESYTEKMTIHGSLTDFAAPTFATSLPGVYRIVTYIYPQFWTPFDETGKVDLVPLVERVSTAFVIRR